MDLSSSTEIDDDNIFTDSADEDEEDLENDTAPPDTDQLKTYDYDDSTPKNQKEIRLTKALALKGISKVSMTYKERDKKEDHLGKVVALHLQKFGIQALIPDELETFYSLAHLYLYDNKIQKIEGLECLPQLESLHLSGNHISRIENLGSCVNLRRLYLGHNKIEVVEGLENLSMLLELHIEYQKLPPEQPLLFCPNSLDLISRKLKVLNISGNQLDSIEDLMCMDVLDTLHASRNNLSDLDQVTVILKTLRQLRVVDLKNNPVTKNPRYKERIVGYLNRLEVLDGKDINEVTRCSLQRLCSVKAMRVRNQVNKAMISKAPSVFGSVSGIGPTGNQPNMIISKQFPPEMMEHSQSDFHFSTPISASPTPDQQNQHVENPKMRSQNPKVTPGHGQYDSKVNDNLRNATSGMIKPDLEKVYASRTSNQLEEENDPDKMSEMAKIIFRLSNLSPSVEGSSVENYVKSRESAYWNGSVNGGGVGSSLSAIKESRPLSPLEIENGLKSIHMSSSSSKAFNIRRSAPAPMRRPMVRKLPPRINSMGAGRTLSPLEELPTPRDGNGSIQSMEEILGKSFQASTCSLPPWPHITRKKGLVPPKVVFMP